MKKSLLYLAFFCLVILGAMHYSGHAFYLYWNVRWYDSLAHFLGGISIGFLFLWLWYDSGLFGRSVPNKKQVFLASFLCVMFVGIGWELFEYAYGISNPIGSYSIDTFSDLVADFVGAVFAGMVGANKKFYE